jgi:hypothetical protein
MHKKAIKLPIVIIWDITAANVIQNFMEYPSFTVKSYVDDITGDHQYGFRRNRPTTDEIFCIRLIMEKKGSTM